MKKIRGISALFTVFALAACAGDSAEETPEPTPAATPAATTPAATQPATPTNVTLPEGVTQEMVTAGAALWGTKTCFTCHGTDATGTALAPNLTDSTWLNVDGSFDAIVQLVQTGVPTPKEHPAPMPAMGGAQLTEDEIRQLAAYVYALGHGG